MIHEGSRRDENGKMDWSVEGHIHQLAGMVEYVPLGDAVEKVKMLKITSPADEVPCPALALDLEFW